MSGNHGVQRYTPQQHTPQRVPVRVVHTHNANAQTRNVTPYSQLSVDALQSEINKTRNEMRYLQTFITPNTHIKIQELATRIRLLTNELNSRTTRTTVVYNANVGRGNGTGRSTHTARFEN